MPIKPKRRSIPRAETHAPARLVQDSNNAHHTGHFRLNVIGLTKRLRKCTAARNWPLALALLVAVFAGLLFRRSAQAELERLPPLTEQARPAPNWAEESLAWSNKVQRGTVGVDALSPYGDADAAPEEDWAWHLLAPGLVWRSYLAGVKEPRLASYWNSNRGHPLWDLTLGGRVSLVRYGTLDPLLPRGFEVQLEGAAFPRLDPNAGSSLQSADFRFGIPLVYARGPWEFKFAYYHLGTTLAGQFMLNNPGVMPNNYRRDALVAGAAYRWTPDLRLYAEAGWGFQLDGGARPWEFQFGVDYSPIAPMGFRPAPFFAVNGYVREDVNYGGSFVAQSGFQWRGAFSGNLLRLGVQYFNGKSLQFQFFRQFEQQIGIGLWYDY